MSPTAPAYSASSAWDSVAPRSATVLSWPEATSFRSTATSSLPTESSRCCADSTCCSSGGRTPSPVDGLTSPLHIRAAIAPTPAASEKIRTPRTAYNSTLIGRDRPLTQFVMPLPCSLVLPASLLTHRQNQNRLPRSSRSLVAGCTIGSPCPRCPKSGQRSQPLPINVVCSVAYTWTPTEATVLVLRSSRNGCPIPATRRCRTREGRMGPVGFVRADAGSYPASTQDGREAR